MDLKTLIENNPVILTFTFVAAGFFVGQNFSDLYRVVPLTREITKLETKVSACEGQVKELDAAKESSEKNKQNTSTEIYNGRSEIIQLKGVNESLQKNNETLLSYNAQWKESHENLQLQNRNLQKTCNIMQHINQVSIEKNNVEDYLKGYINNNDIPRAEEYRRRSVQLQDRLLKLESGLVNATK